MKTYRGHKIDESDEWTPVRIQKQLIDEAVKERKIRDASIQRLRVKPELWKQSLRYLIYTHNPLVAEWVKVINSMTAKKFLEHYDNGSLFNLIEVNYGQFLEMTPFAQTERRLARNVVLR